MGGQRVCSDDWIYSSKLGDNNIHWFNGVIVCSVEFCSVFVKIFMCNMSKM